MKTKESTVKIFETDKFDGFKTLKCNRGLDMNLVKKIKDSVLKEDLLAFNPILVTSDMEVIDGQHRLEVCKQLGHTVFYIVKPKLTSLNTENCVRELNINKKNWDNNAYLNFYVQKGDAIYKEFFDFMQSNNLSLMSAVTLFSGNCTSNQSFRKGKLVKVEKYWDIILKALNATRLANNTFNNYLMDALVKFVSKRKVGYTEFFFNKLVEKLEFAAAANWRSSSKYLDLLEGRIQLK